MIYGEIPDKFLVKLTPEDKMKRAIQFNRDAKNAYIRDEFKTANHDIMDVVVETMARREAGAASSTSEWLRQERHRQLYSVKPSDW